MQHNLTNLLSRLRDIHDGFVTLGRLLALKVFSIQQMNDKIPVLASSEKYLKQAKIISEFANHAYAIKDSTIVWRKAITPYSYFDASTSTINLGTLEQGIATLCQSLTRAILNLKADTAFITALQPLYLLLSEQLNLPMVESNDAMELALVLGDKNDTLTVPDRCFFGPQQTLLDRAFKPEQSILDTPVHAYSDSIIDAAAYYWGLSARECLASDLCALSLIEYDGLPIDFYIDMSKQAYDEIRHASSCLEVASCLISDIKQTLPTSHPLYQPIMTFTETNTGLPIPLERNLYEAIWNATLDERLVLMHYDTEAVGIQRIREKIQSLISQQYPFIAQLLEIILREEITHARLGKKWLHYLYPDKTMLKETINRARTLRSILLLSSTATHKQIALSTLIDDIIQTNTADNPQGDTT